MMVMLSVYSNAVWCLVGGRGRGLFILYEYTTVIEVLSCTKEVSLDSLVCSSVLLFLLSLECSS